MKPLLLLFVGALVIVGCRSSVESISTGVVTEPAAVDRPLPEPVRQRILGHFIEGASLDAQGKYAEAILEYQEVVRLDPENTAAYYALSRDYAELNRHARSAEYAREAVRRDSTNVLYRENLAQVYVNTFQPELAAREYEAALAIDSNRTVTWYHLARLLQRSKPLRALELYEQIMEREGETWDVLLQVAEIHSALGQYDRAVDRYETMLAIDPGNDALKRQLAETYSRAGRFDDARQLLEGMLELHPNDPDVALVLADLYADQGDPGKARALYETVLSNPTLHPEVRMRVGVTLFSLSERDQSFLPMARSVFEHLRTERPDDWRPHWYLGAMALNHERDSNAAAYFAEVTRLEPRNGDAWWFLGSLYFEQGRYDKVFEAMYKARQTLPNDFRVPLLLGLAHSRVSEEQEAVRELTKAYRLNPRDINVLSSLALTLDGLDRHAESDSLYEEALTLDSANALVLNNYSYSLSERGLQLERALQMATVAVAAEPGNASYLDTFGWIYYMMGSYDSARVYIEQAVATGDASPVVIEHLGDVYDKLGRTADARTQWNRALELQPDKQSLRQKLGILTNER